MPYFQCRLATQEGQVLKQTFLAFSKKDCRKHFEEQGYCVLSVKRDWKRFRIAVHIGKSKIKIGDFILFNQELMALTKAGHPILKSIASICRRTKSTALKEVLMEVEKDIRDGKSLSEAFVAHEAHFSKVYTASLMAGERSGNLPELLGRYIDYARTIDQTKKRIRSALTYPTVLVVFSLILLGILINFVLPRFSEFYANFEAQLPAVTRGLMTLAFFLRRHFILILALVLVMAVVYWKFKNEEKIAVAVDKLKLKLPLGKTIWKESGIALFSRTLGLLLEAGISLLHAVGIARMAVPNSYLVYQMRGLVSSIENGESLSEALAKAEFLPPMSLDLIQIGEASANLEGMLREVADVYDERIQAKINQIVSLIEPIIIIFIGLVIAAMLLSVYLPIFNIIRVVR
ncbi:MAG: type II secretion system F family protein [Candidatus Aminicenantes bacterium]|nr:type II secretion system F family protein [Candidatus Aminicenantes bacterium]